MTYIWNLLPKLYVDIDLKEGDFQITLMILKGDMRYWNCVYYYSVFRYFFPAEITLGLGAQLYYVI